MLTSEGAITALRTTGLRITPQRRALIGLLADNRTHPSADAIAAELSQRMPGVSLTTVYSTLHEFAGLGLVRELDLPGSMRFDPDTSDHAHLVCAECGSIVDLPLTSETAAIVAHPPLVRIDRVDITAYGRCDACAVTRDGQSASDR